ncbi:hypothetical protein IGI04_019003 [Brassica rapa subsp. trilocularis]|uniref:Uncharacterized protein n=1 Tax=Brassica rapa subsp. trilocularis TaxID=1813537 RepID=A0ABQ7MEL2_BRACM|nr:hypothetical protein IGI04_019003 [Brassica rapa subsp. trilocularis]
MKTIKFKEFIQQFRHHGSSTSDEVHHAIFKASKLLHGDDELLMPKEEVELKGGLLERFTHEMEPFLRKQGMHVRLNKRYNLILIVIARCIPTKNTFATTVSNIDQDLAQEKCVPRAR